MIWGVFTDNHHHQPTAVHRPLFLYASHPGPVPILSCYDPQRLLYRRPNEQGDVRRLVYRFLILCS